MISDGPLQYAPPWGSKNAWQAVHGNIGYHIHRYEIELRPVVTIARRIRDRLASVFPLLDDLGAATCFRCPFPCCLSASPWYDLRDLLFLHLNYLPIPITQPVETYGAACCYLSPKGCTLPRAMRPWICTWYLCPVQKANLRKQGPDSYETFNRTLDDIKRCRRQLEDSFIRIIV
jgi:hypothetical protein